MCTLWNCYHLAELQTICREYWNKVARLESDKYDLEIIEQMKKFEVIGQPHELLNLILFKIFFLFVYYFSYKQTKHKTKQKKNSNLSKKI